MLTPTQKRAMRAQSLLNNGMDAKEAARECGYKNVNGMMGAIALFLRKIPEEDVKNEMQHLLDEQESKQTQKVREGEYIKPGVYKLNENKTVLVGERISPEEWEKHRKAYIERVRAKQAECRDTIRVETKRVICKYDKDDAGQQAVKMHIRGIDKWLLIDEEIIGGKEELMNVLGDLVTSLSCILEGMA